MKRNIAPMIAFKLGHNYIRRDAKIADIAQLAITPPERTEGRSILQSDNLTLRWPWFDQLGRTARFSP